MHIKYNTISIKHSWNIKESLNKSLNKKFIKDLKCFLECNKIIEIISIILIFMKN